jgi:hypothetical protein
MQMSWLEFPNLVEKLLPAAHASVAGHTRLWCCIGQIANVLRNRVDRSCLLLGVAAAPAEEQEQHGEGG